MRYDNNPGMNLGRLLLLGAAIFGAYKLGKHIEDNCFKGKTEQEVSEMIYNAFAQIDAYSRLVKDGGELLQNAVYNLRSGYNSLNSTQIDPEAIKKLYSVIDSIEKISKGANEIKQPLEIIDQSLHLLEQKAGK